MTDKIIGFIMMLPVFSLLFFEPVRIFLAVIVTGVLAISICAIIVVLFLEGFERFFRKG